jgi:hypothetical protein
MGGRNVVVIVLDSARKDDFDDLATSIRANSDVSIDRCRAVSSTSPPSHGSMFTGSLPNRSGIYTEEKSYDETPMAETVFQQFADHRRVGMSANIFLSTAFEFDRYFDRFVTLTQLGRYPEAPNPRNFSANERREGDSDLRTALRYVRASLEHDRMFGSLYNGVVGLAERYTARRIHDAGARPALRIAREELAASDPAESVFMFMNLMETHIPFEPAHYLDLDGYDGPAGWTSSDRDSVALRLAETYDASYWDCYRALYRAELAYVDDLLGRFVRDVDDDTTVVVTSDHGEAMGHVNETIDQFRVRRVHHHMDLTEELLHVPLEIINCPISVTRADTEYVSLLRLPDLLRAIEAGQDVELSEPTVRAERLASPKTEAEFPEPGYWNRTLRCACRDGRKVVWDTLGNVVEYDVGSTPPSDQKKLRRPDDVPEWARATFDIDIESAHGLVDGDGPRRVAPAVEQRLQRLGYR